MEKKRFDLYVKGYIIYRGYMSANGNGDICIAPPEEVDLMHGIIVEGDMIVDSIYVVGKKVGASGIYREA